MRRDFLILYCALILGGCSVSPILLDESTVNGHANNQRVINGDLSAIFVPCTVKTVELPRTISSSFNSPASAILTTDRSEVPNIGNRFEYRYEVYTSNGSDIIPDFKEGTSIILMFSQDGTFLGRASTSNQAVQSILVPHRTKIQSRVSWKKTNKQSQG